MHHYHLVSHGEFRLHAQWLLLILIVCHVTCDRAVAQSWRAVGHIDQPAHGYLRGLSFIDDQNGWAINSYQGIYHTTDGGMTWVKQVNESSNAIVALAFIDNSTGIYIASTNTKLHIKRTTDGGLTWQTVASDTATAERPFIIASTITVVNTRVVYVAGLAVVYKSTDAGTTWQTVPTPKEPSPGQPLNDAWESISCSDENNCWVTELGYGRTLHTTDGGKTWASVVVGNTQGSLAATSDSIIYACNTYTSFYATTDGGLSWRTHDLQHTLPYGMSLNQMVFITSSYGHIAGVIGVITTTDGGMSFRYDTTGFSNGDFIYLACAPSGRCWALSLTGAVMRSDAQSIVPVSPREDQPITLTAQGTQHLLGFAPRSHQQRISIVDRVGRHVSEQDVPPGASSLLLDTAQLPSGLYFVQVEDTVIPMMIIR